MESFGGFSIANQLKYGLPLIVGLGILGIGGLLIVMSFNAQVELLYDIQHKRSQVAAQEINAYLDDLQSKLGYLARVRGLYALSPEIQQHFLEALTRHNSAYEAVAIMNRHGQVMATVHPYGKTSWEDPLSLRAFQHSFNGKEDFLSSVKQDPLVKQPFITMAVPVRNQQDEVSGALLAKINLGFLWFVVDNTEVGLTGYSYIMDEQGFLIAQKGVPADSFNRQSLSSYSFIQKITAEPTAPVLTYQGLRGMEVIGASTLIEGSHWFVVVELPVAEAYRSLYRKLLFMGFALLLAVVISIGIGILFSMKIVLPLRRLTDAASQISSGNLVAEVDIKGSNELGLLAEAFNRMSVRLQELIHEMTQKVTELEKSGEALKESEKRYRLLFEEMPISLWEEDCSGVKGRIDQLRAEGIKNFDKYFEEHPDELAHCASLVKRLSINKHALAMYQAKSKEELMEGLPHIFNEAGFVIFRNELIALAEGHTSFVAETENYTLKKEKIHIHLHLSIAPGYEDSWSKVLLSVHDITDRKQAEEKIKEYADNLEQMVEDRTKEIKTQAEKIQKSQDALTYLMQDVNHSRLELEESNQELEKEIAERQLKEKQIEQYATQLERANNELKDFAYIVSHDLKAPLRAVAQLAQWLSQDYGEILGEEGKELTDLLMSRVSRMYSLIEGILSYSRIGRVQEKKERVDLNMLAAEVIGILDLNDNIQVSVKTELPVIFADATRMEQVFQNLLSNAITYMDKPQGTIGIDCQDEENQWKFSIEDNGPGIDQKYYEKIFQIFQTLASKDDYEGTGIGLTLVKKIIEMYGGAIWLESEPGEGTTFFFTFPKKGNDDEQ
ncbi:MAG: HAMP domain-containing protein [SAR324 cluster bacterium]|nr:HAMP domain-containing protein [SAR324 cluster bacterium]